MPHLTAQESLLLRLAEEHLRHLLPPQLVDSMDGLFPQARRNLSGGGGSSGVPLEREWPRKVRVVATSQPLLPPHIRAGVLEHVSEALYANRWLELDYENAAGQRRPARVMPLGLAQQGAGLYLVCRYEGYDNERSLALHRIHHAQASTLTFERPRDFDLQCYDEDGRFGFGEGERIHWAFASPTAPAATCWRRRWPRTSRCSAMANGYTCAPPWWTAPCWSAGCWDSVSGCATWSRCRSETRRTAGCRPGRPRPKSQSR